MALYLSGDPEADQFISDDPLALLIGMVLDQQVPLEKAFAGPWILRQRLGTELDAADIAAMDPGRLAALFVERPALHRFPGSMAARVQDLCRVLVERVRRGRGLGLDHGRDGRGTLQTGQGPPRLR